MLAGTQIDRRQVKSRAFRLGRPIFMQVPRALAASSLAACTLVAFFANNAFPMIGFGPFFLLICAFGAWFVGNIYAVLLGVFIAFVQVKTDNVIILHDGPFVMALQFCSALAVVLMLGVARAALEIEWQFARIDPLTGALNRKAFFEAVKGESRQAGITVLLFADVDGLKRLNDSLGHEAGDDALRDFSDRVRKAVRRNDIFARIGGDEFVIFLKVRTMAAADLVAKRLNAELNQDSESEHIRLNCSLGALVLPSGSKSIDSELKQADTLMYHAKRKRLGMMMAISVKGDMEELIPYAKSTNYQGEQRASVRWSARA